jgi:hypothetical protein
MSAMIQEHWPKGSQPTGKEGKVGKGKKKKAAE